ncbi:hypothetical protein [Bacillus toyonensis]|uniref:hypothetical protein n=1 Tax=Bacillus toyonensis TaxID=155322 RepID=UPI002E1C7EF8|nr:hypothetical protein [Bacillus toyonensis]
MKFKTREPLEDIKKINPTENIDELTRLFNELADYGWNSQHWSEKSPEYTADDILKFCPTYFQVSERAQGRIRIEFYKTLPPEFFIETFGDEKEGLLRAEGKSLVECAEKQLAKAKKQAVCEHQWQYTHSNGHKTCGECGKFTGCTVEEALAHYEIGNVDYDDETTLYFNNNMTVCECGSHKVLYLQHSMFFEKQFKCMSCQKFLPLKFKNLSYSSVPVYPNSVEYKTATLNNTDTMYDRHRIVTLGLITENDLRFKITEYIKNMMKHYVYIEGNSSTSEFIDWVTPYVYQIITKANTQIIMDGQKLKLLGIRNLLLEINIKEQIFDINYELETKVPETENPEPAEVFTEIFNTILKEGE